MLVFSWDFVALLRFDKLRQLAYWDAFFGLLARFIRSATDSVSLAKKLELILSTHGCKLYSARLGPWPLHAAKANTLWHCPAVASKEWQFKKIEIFEEIKYNRYMAGCYVKSIVKSFIANNPRLLRNRVAPLFLQKGLDFVVEYIRSVRNWKEHLPTVAALSGAYRRRSKRDETVIPHSFTFVQRCSAPIQFDSICFENFVCLQLPLPHNSESFWIYFPALPINPWSMLPHLHSGMPSTLLQQAVERMPRRFRPSGNDTFCLVKGFVSDSALSQPPLLVLPGDSVQSHVEPAIRSLALARCPRFLS